MHDRLSVAFSLERAPLCERRHPLMEARVQLKNGMLVPAAELAERFWWSKHGKFMANKQPLRFSQRYDTGPSMETDLGHDVNPIGHQIEAMYHCARILEHETNPENVPDSLEIGEVMLALGMHDCGEDEHPETKAAVGQTVGDIPAGMKTDEDRAVEAKVRALNYQRYLPDVNASTMQRIEALISHQDETLLHDLFDAAHELQTFETSHFADTAWLRERWFKEGELIDPADIKDPERLSALLGISRSVSHQHISHLIRYRRFALIDQAVRETEARLNIQSTTAA